MESQLKLKVGYLGFLLLLIIIYWVIADSEEYYPHIIAPFTQINAIIIALMACAFDYSSTNHSLQKRINYFWAALLILLSLFVSLKLIQVQIHPWTLLWTFSAFLIWYGNKNKNTKDTTISINGQEMEFEEYGNKQLKQSFEIQTKFDRFSKNISNGGQKRWINKNCLKNIMFLLTIVLISLFALNAKNTAYYKVNFPIMGKMLTFKAEGEHYKVSFHYYCSKIQNSKYPTIILEHGGGGNLIGFLPLLQDLQAQGIKVCVYDRLGYGRSSKIIPHTNLKTHSKIVNQLWSHVLRSDERIIYGGWSAGVQLSIAYSYYFPQQIDGLIFMDGYPNYLLLEAISSNASTIRNPHTSLIAGIFRFIEPYGLDTFFGKNPIQNSTTNSYYDAYYKTGYLWDTQSTQVRYDNTTTEISQMGKQSGAILPYPNAHFYLNWPDIYIPLLVMPANNTVSANQYRMQSEKYMQKCSNKFKRLQIIEGAHDFVLISHTKVARIITEFVQGLTT